MRLLLVGSIVLPFCLTDGVYSGETQDPASGITWCADLATAKARAKDDGQPVILFFTFDTCHWCHVLKEKTFPDAAVVEKSRAFHWVEVNRDRDPQTPERFHVSAYPSLLVLGASEENVYRFQSYKQPPEFLAELEEGLRRYALYRKGEKWDLEPERPSSITAEGTLETFKAPSEDICSGIAFLGGKLLLAQGTVCRRIDLAEGGIEAQIALPESVADLCTDGEKLYAVSFAWTAGEPIHVIDPASGKVEREIVTEANKTSKAHGAKGIAWVRGELAVLRGMEGRIDFVSPKDGAIARSVATGERWLAGLCFDGTHLVAGSREALLWIDPATGAVAKKIAVNYPLRAVGVHEGAVFLLEQPLFGFDAEQKPIRTWPKRMLVHVWRAK